jgi:hypothetical protein
MHGECTSAVETGRFEAGKLMSGAARIPSKPSFCRNGVATRVFGHMQGHLKKGSGYGQWGLDPKTYLVTTPPCDSHNIISKAFDDR